MRAVPAATDTPDDILRWLQCTGAAARAGGGSPLDQAVWASPAAAGLTTAAAR
jgi:Mg2+-importing ATPase